MNYIKYRQIKLVIMLAVVLLTPGMGMGIVHAAEASTQLEYIGSVKQGEAFVIKGTTSLPEVMIRIMRPNQTILEMDLMSSEQLLVGKIVTMPENAPLGQYTVEVGVGADVTALRFTTMVKIGGGDPGPVDPDPIDPGPVKLLPVNPGPNGSGIINVKAGKPDAYGKAIIIMKQDVLNDAIVQSKDGKVTIIVEKMEGAKVYQVDLPASAFAKDKAKNTITISTELADIVVKENMFAGSDGNTISFSIARQDKSLLSEKIREAVGQRPVVELSVTIDGKEVSWPNGKERIQVAIPYVPTANERTNPEQIVIWHIDSNGRAVPVISGRYDATTGKASFNATQPGQYAVVYNKLTFADLSNHQWAKKQIDVLAAKGIITGTSKTTFIPAANIKRADFVLLLVRTLELSAIFESSFDDINRTDYYYDALGVAKQLGITTGVGNNQFLPDEEISRQDMMVLVEKAMIIAGRMDVSDSTTDLNQFADASSVASYAVDSVANVVKSGIIIGSSGGLNPLGDATRAETAVILYRIYND